MASLRGWLAEQGLALDGEVTATLLAGGRSNLSYRLDDSSGRALVVRRPPLGHVMPSAHDMGREFRVMSGLNRVGFPTPPARALCDDVDVIGASFMVMDFVPGTVIDSEEAAVGLDESLRSRISGELIDTLAALHQIDPETAGLESLGRPDGYLTRQVHRWGRQWELSATRELPVLDTLAVHLQQQVAEAEAASTASIVHGDYRIDNTILAPGGDGVRAVVDWEMATLGDPAADLAVSLVYWVDPGDGLRGSVPVSEHITDQPGFWNRSQLVERYAEQAGSALHHLDFCTALACYKLAIIMESIRYRALSGQQLGAAADDVEEMGRATEALAELGMEVLARGTIEGLRQ